MRRAEPSLPRHQRGALLILLVIALGVLAATVFVSMLSSSDIQNKRNKQTAAALAEAKAALIGRAMRDDSRPGSLPCPDTNNDGSADMFSGTQCPSYIGRLPWRTLGLPDLRDGYGERLWYAFSIQLTDYPSTQGINSNTSLNLQVYGSDKVTPLTSVGNEAAAVIFSAGPVLNGQSRDAANTNNAPDYLDKTGTSPSDIDNAKPGGPFIQGPVRDSAGNIIVNDKLMIITRHDLFSAVEKRIAYEIVGINMTPSNALRGYYSIYGGYPFATDSPSSNNNKQQPGLLSGLVPFNDPDYLVTNLPMLMNNKWFDLAAYSISSISAARDSASIQLRYCTASSSMGATTHVNCP